MESRASTRESGYYWIRIKDTASRDCWEIAEYREGTQFPWHLTDVTGGITEDAIDEVGDRLLPPGQNNQSASTTAFNRFGPQPFTEHYWFTEDGVPDGGILNGSGFTISIQRGTVETAESGELAPNGVFTQTLVAVLISVLENLYQKSKFANRYNEEAIAHFKAGQDALRRRLLDRDERGVLNTHEP